ncbi:MAG: hypothetical protein LBD23_15640 [Oscillospiraceae bacterium]|nr:hypothetical protein [Oscillospiraceae bacterium]
MYNYELTERGKIIIAIVLVLLLLVLPSVVLAVKAWNSTPLPDDLPNSTVSDPEDTPEDPNGPLPNGSGFDPNDDPQDDNGKKEPPDPTPDPTDDPPDVNPIIFDRAEGTVEFVFSPDLHESLDSDTVKILGDFIRSPKNVRGAQIAIEIPQLPEDELAIILSAITDAFAQHGISQELLAFITYPSQTLDVRSIDVKLSFLPPEDRK